MSRQQPSTDAEWQNVQRRRGVRIVLSLPVKVAWVTKEGKRVSRHAETEVVSAYGATLWMKTPPPTSTEVELTHGRTRKSVRARVLRAHPPKKNQTPQIAVELKAPSESFWGPNYQLQKAGLELRQLELAIPAEDIDARVLDEFRRAVDYVRQASWAMHQWIDLQAKGHDPYGILSVLTTERVKRLTQLTGTLSSDLDAAEVSFETAGLMELAQAVAGLHRRLTHLLKK